MFSFYFLQRYDSVNTKKFSFPKNRDECHETIKINTAKYLPDQNQHQHLLTRHEIQS